ncbi:hypothetical protein [Streptomyces sp. MNP-20]|uniref:hypothetical protein n=1 Tax=Streptomyces sp. MNP-20 TaxID=2721165 RepID=UPI001552FFC8|nr:hypothetical protein [Streptomyces sp. MNP-20]
MAADDVTDELVEATLSIVDGWYSGERIDWADVLDRLERCTLDDGRGVDMGVDTNSPAIRRLKSRVRAELRNG